MSGFPLQYIVFGYDDDGHWAGTYHVHEDLFGDPAWYLWKYRGQSSVIIKAKDRGAVEYRAAYLRNGKRGEFAKQKATKAERKELNDTIRLFRRVDGNDLPDLVHPLYVEDITSARIHFPDVAPRGLRHSSRRRSTRR